MDSIFLYIAIVMKNHTVLRIYLTFVCLMKRDIARVFLNKI